jgi:hypothetical protein
VGIPLIGDRRVNVAVIWLLGQDIKPSPKLVSTVKDSVNLVRLVLAEVEGRG